MYLCVYVGRGWVHKNEMQGKPYITEINISQIIIYTLRIIRLQHKDMHHTDGFHHFLSLSLSLSLRSGPALPLHESTITMTADDRWKSARQPHGKPHVHVRVWEAAKAAVLSGLHSGSRP